MYYNTINETAQCSFPNPEEQLIAKEYFMDDSYHGGVDNLYDEADYYFFITAPTTANLESRSDKYNPFLNLSLETIGDMLEVAWACIRSTIATEEQKSEAQYDSALLSIALTKAISERYESRKK